MVNSRATSQFLVSNYTARVRQDVVVHRSPELSLVILCKGVKRCDPIPYILWVVGQWEKFADPWPPNKYYCTVFPANFNI